MRCRAPQPAWKFALFKYGEITPMLFRVVSTDLAEVFLEEVTPAQGGSYQCSYQNPGWVLGVWSHPSDALELLVTGEVLGEREKGHRSGMRERRDRDTQASKMTQKKEREGEQERARARE